MRSRNTEIVLMRSISCRGAPTSEVLSHSSCSNSEIVPQNSLQSLVSIVINWIANLGGSSIPIALSWLLKSFAAAFAALMSRGVFEVRQTKVRPFIWMVVLMVCVFPWLDVTVAPMFLSFLVASRLSLFIRDWALMSSPVKRGSNSWVDHGTSSRSAIGSVPFSFVGMVSRFDLDFSRCWSANS